MRNTTLAGLNWRIFSLLEAGLGAAAALAPHVVGVAHASSPSAPFGQEIVRAEKFGVNEAFKAMRYGAGWRRWTVQWFNVPPCSAARRTQKTRGSSSPPSHPEVQRASTAHSPGAYSARDLTGMRFYRVATIRPGI